MKEDGGGLGLTDDRSADTERSRLFEFAKNGEGGREQGAARGSRKAVMRKHQRWLGGGSKGGLVLLQSSGGRAEARVGDGLFVVWRSVAVWAWAHGGSRKEVGRSCGREVGRAIVRDV